jgi:hypothetical protein
MFWRISTFLAVFLCAATALAGKVRTWTNSEGKTMEAEFVRELDGDVTFLKGGKLLVIKMEKLSEKDQQVVKDLSAGKEPEEDPFTAPPEKPAEKPAESSGEKPAAPATTPAGKSNRPTKPVVIQTRTWTDRFGNKSTGKFVRVDGNDVVINRGTRVITVVFGNLSDGDQEYVRNLLISQGKEDAIPSATPANGPAGVGPGMPGGVGGGGAGGMPPGAGMPGTVGPGGFPRGAGPGMQGPGMPPVGGARGGFAPPSAQPGMSPPDSLPGAAGGPMGGAGMGVGIGGAPGMRPPGAGGFGGPMGTADPASMMGAGGFAGAGMPGTMGGAPGMAGGGMGPAAGMAAGMGPGGMPSGMGGAAMGARAPTMEPASIPSFENPSFPNIHMEEVYECSKCRVQLTKLEAAGSTCPRCNTTWGYKQDELGRKTMTAAGRSQMGSAGAIIVVFVLLGLVVFFALFIGIIVAVVKAATAPRSHQQPMPQQRYY